MEVPTAFINCEDNSTKKASCYVFTFHNWTDEIWNKFKNLSNIYYISMSQEICPKTKTPHIQGYVQFMTRYRYRSIFKMIGADFFVRHAKGDEFQNWDYTSKTEGTYYCWGSPVKQGQRNDIIQLRDDIKEGMSFEEYCKSTPNYQGLMIFPKIVPYVEPKRVGRPECYWFWGLTGRGKTFAADEICGLNRRITIKNDFWLGYDGWDTVVIDDYREGACPFVDLLRWLDEGSCVVNTKQGHRQLRAMKIVITSPFHPRDTFTRLPRGERIEQLESRLKEIREFTGPDRRRGPILPPTSVQELLSKNWSWQNMKIDEFI